MFIQLKINNYELVINNLCGLCVAVYFAFFAVKTTKCHENLF